MIEQLRPMRYLQLRLICRVGSKVHNSKCLVSDPCRRTGVWMKFQRCTQQPVDCIV
jgi:hypothetical protein